MEGTVPCESMYLVPCYSSPCGSHPGRPLRGHLYLIHALVDTSQVCIIGCAIIKICGKMIIADYRLESITINRLIGDIDK